MKMGLKFRRYIHLFMTQVLSFYSASDDLVTLMDTVSTFMEHSVQDGKTSDKLMNRGKIRQDNVVESS